MTGPETVSVPANTAGLGQAADFAERFSVRLGLSDELRRSLLTALDEVLSNVTRHGFAGRVGAIDLTMSAGDGVVTAEVSDPARAFNPLLAPVPDTTTPLEARRAGGLGIALVRALTHEIAYEHRDGRNHLTLRWRIDDSGKGREYADH